MLRLCWLLLNLSARAARRFAALPREAAAALAADGDRARATKRLLWATLLAVSAGLLTACLLARVTLVMSPSIDAWAVTPAPGPIRKGDLVQFTLSHPIAGPTSVSVTKYALCMPGDRLRIEPRPATDIHATASFFCNGAPLGVSLRHGRGGVRLSPARIAGIIPDGLVYVGSPHPHGFDSRYFGLVRIERLNRMERLF
jgi:conjugal transfer pilin signal peptidase TrbI